MIIPAVVAYYLKLTVIGAGVGLLVYWAAEPVQAPSEAKMALYRAKRDEILELCDKTFPDRSKLHKVECDRSTIEVLARFRKMDFRDVITYYPEERERFYVCNRNLDGYLTYDKYRNGGEENYPTEFYSDAMEQFALLFNSFTVILIFFCLGVIVGRLAWFFPAGYSVRQFNVLSAFDSFFSSLISSLKYFSKIRGFMLTGLLLIVFFNGVGLLPSAPTFTSSIIVPFALAASVFLFCTFYGAINYKSFYFASFLPESTDYLISLLLTPIEFVSNIVKYISLAVRLFANMFAGHILLKTLYSITAVIITFLKILFLIIVPFVSSVVSSVLLLEFSIAGLQGYVFAMLSFIFIASSFSSLEH